MSRWRTTRGAFHRARAFAPRRPFERPAPALTDAAVWPPRGRPSTTFGSTVPFRVRSNSTPVHASVASGPRFLWVSVSLADFCNRKTTRGHTLRAVDPRTRVGLSPRCSPAPTDAGCVGPAARCRVEDLRATTRTRGLTPPRSTCVDGASRGPRRSREGMGVLLDDVAHALLVGASGTRVTGAPRRGAWSAPRRDAQAEIHLGRSLAKGDAVGRIGVPSAATESLRERRRIPSVRARTGAPLRRLRRGIAPERARLFGRLLGACP